MYYDDNEKKSNTKKDVFSIFNGKKQTYNKLILKSLLSSPKNVKQISIFIYQNEPKKRPKHIYSVIDRPKGRLSELSSKGYIEKKEGRWQLTFKGFCVALTLFKSIDEAIPFLEDIDRRIKDEVRKRFEKLLLQILGKAGYANVKLMDYVSEKFRETWRRVEGDLCFSELLLLKLKEYTEELIKERVPLDVLSDEEFIGCIFSKLLRWFLERYVFIGGLEWLSLLRF